MRRAAVGSRADPPGFLHLAGHGVRWRLLSELAYSDRRVGELCAALQAPQSLVSYHLGCLRAEGVVVRRRSSADRRDSYYTLDLTRCGELLAAAGAALHPGLRLVRPQDVAPRPAGEQEAERARALFLCTGNSARSQIAAALCRGLSDGGVEARSAGSHPKPVHPYAVRVLAQRGIDISGLSSTHLNVLVGERFDVIVTLCDRVREVCPEFPGHPNLIHWSNT